MTQIAIFIFYKMKKRIAKIIIYLYVIIPLIISLYIDTIITLAVMGIILLIIILLWATCEVSKDSIPWNSRRDSFHIPPPPRHRNHGKHF